MTNPSLYCGDLWCSPWAAAKAAVTGQTSAIRWSQFQQRRLFLLYRSRFAIARLLKAWGLGPGDEVLAPAYNCGTEIDSIFWCGANPVLYRIDAQTRLDPDEVRRRITPRTRALLVIHYFGWPQHWEELREDCERNRIRVLEDCALSLFSRGPLGPLGTCGDAATYSFPKTLPVPHGGALVLHGDGDFEIPSGSVHPSWKICLKESLPLFKRYLVHRADNTVLGGLSRQYLERSWLPHTKTSPTPKYPDIPHDYYLDETKLKWGMTRMAGGLLDRFDERTIVERRRENYNVLDGEVESISGIKRLYQELPEGVCPLSMPILVSNRTSWFLRLQERRIHTLPWWGGFHQRLDWDNHPEARDLKNQVLTLPIHQGLDERHMAYMAQCLREIAADQSGGRRS